MLPSKRHDPPARFSPRRFVAARMLLATVLGIGIAACSSDKIAGLTEVDAKAKFSSSIIWCVSGGNYADSITCAGGIECTWYASFAGGSGSWNCSNGCTIYGNGYNCPGGGGGEPSGTAAFDDGTSNPWSEICPTENQHCLVFLRPQDVDSLQTGLQHVNRGDPLCAVAAERAEWLMSRHPSRVYRGNPLFTAHNDDHGAETVTGDSTHWKVHIDEDEFNTKDARTVATLLLHEALHTIYTDDHHTGVRSQPYPGGYGHIETCIPPNS